MTAPRFPRGRPPTLFLEQLWRVKAPLLAKRWQLTAKAVEAWRRRERQHGRGIKAEEMMQRARKLREQDEVEEPT